MALLIQLYENENWKSPILYIHSDEKEALTFIEEWRIGLIKWAKNTKHSPLSRLDCSTALVDLVHKISNYYLETGGQELYNGQIASWLRLISEDEAANHVEEIIKIKLEN
jgi:hypothetical protein